MPSQPRSRSIDAASWMKMPPAKRAALLSDHQCLSRQGVIISEYDETRPVWGMSFRFGSSPVPQFALEGRIDCLSEALSLGASPFARDIEGDGPFEYAAGGSSKALHRIAKICWDAGANLLDPSSPDFLGEEESKAIRFDIALAFYSNGSAQAARASGIPIEAAWLFACPGRSQLLRPQMIQWGRPADLAEFSAAGFDFAAWQELPFDPNAEADEPRFESLWLWLEDCGESPEEVARFLISEGSDPRDIDPAATDGRGRLLNPATAARPIDMMAGEPGQARIHSFATALLLAKDEQALLRQAAPSAPERARRAGL